MSRIVQYFADKLRTKKEYPITLTKAVYDEDGERLDNTLSEINSNLTELHDRITFAAPIIRYSGNVHHILFNDRRLKSNSNYSDFALEDIAGIGKPPVSSWRAEWRGNGYVIFSVTLSAPYETGATICSVTVS